MINYDVTANSELEGADALARHALVALRPPQSPNSGPWICLASFAGYPKAPKSGVTRSVLGVTDGWARWSQRHEACQGGGLGFCTFLCVGTE